MERTPIAYAKDYLLSLVEQDSSNNTNRYYQITNSTGVVIHDGLNGDEAVKLFEKYYRG